MRSIRESTSSKISEILNDDQRSSTRPCSMKCGRKKAGARGIVEYPRSFRWAGTPFP
jgi:hypothetical protein